MNVLAALGDAPTAVIAVVAILLGILVVARGQRGDRGDRGERGDEPAGPSLLTVPRAAPAAAGDGLEKMAVHDVGHGTIRLGGVASPHTEPGEEAVWTPAPVVAPGPGANAEAVAEPDRGHAGE